eukprot:gene581-1123_t
MKTFFTFVVLTGLQSSLSYLLPNRLATSMSQSPSWDAKKIVRNAFASILTVSTLSGSFYVQPALADQRLNAATAAGTRVNSDPESLLRYGLPINNKEVRDIQTAVETIRGDLLSRRLQFAKIDLQNAKSQLKRNGANAIKAMPANHVKAATESLDRLQAALDPLEVAISSTSGEGSGSLQEREKLDEAFAAQKVLSKELSAFEELLVPDDFKRDIPAEYSKLPVLRGRAEVDMVIVKADKGKFDVDGKLYDQVQLKLVIDGYNAPITGGNFIDLVNKGFYNNMKITRSDGFVVQTGDADPQGTVHGYIPPGSSTERTIPLEIAFKGDNELLYGMTSEDDGRGALAAVLPFQAYGALGMARSEYEPNSASSQFFWLLFDSDLTPAGKNMLDGRYTCLGYTTENQDLLKDVREGDIIQSAKVVRGKEFLITP